LELLCHQDLRRIGLVTDDDLLQDGLWVDVGRATPAFYDPRARRAGLNNGLWASERSLDLDLPTVAPTTSWTLEADYVSRFQCRIRWAKAQRAFRVEPNPNANLPVVAWQFKGDNELLGTRYECVDLRRGGLLPVGSVLAFGERILVHLTMRPPLRERLPDYGLIGESEAIWALRERMQRLERFLDPLLIMGEPGVGKALVAESVHKRSGLRGEYVAVNAAALDPQTAQAEFLGTDPAAFQGAVARPGLIERADQGTLMLDGVGDAPLPVQPLFMGVLENEPVARIGSLRTRKLKARVIATTHRDLNQRCHAGLFRVDLRNRLRHHSIYIPPLRERRTDVPLLIVAFLRRWTRGEREYRFFWNYSPKSTTLVFPASFMMNQLQQAWFGNVHEVESFVKALMVANREVEHFVIPEFAYLPKPPVLERPQAERARASALPNHYKPSREELLECLVTCKFDQSRTANMLKRTRQTIVNWMSQYKIPRAEDLREEEIVAAVAKHKTLIEASFALQVSPRALQLRLRRLHHDPDLIPLGWLAEPLPEEEVALETDDADPKIYASPTLDPDPLNPLEVTLQLNDQPQGKITKVRRR
jgi:DNA-binding NtrC family response regulator